MLAEAREQRLVGPGPVEELVAHAEAFAVVPAEPPSRGLDLGSGAGIPGLVLARRWAGSRWTLLDATKRRVVFLDAAIERLGLAGRVEAVHGRAEDLGRQPDYRSVFDLVVSRSFGPPPVVAECAAPFLQVSGRLVVSEPPGSDGSRWPANTLDEVGLGQPHVHRGDYTLVELQQERPCPERYPRRAGIPAKRPLA